jgi:cobalt-zinc-cadmium efflux system protein
MHGHHHHDHDHAPGSDGEDPHDHHADLQTRALAAFRTSTLLNGGLVVVEAGIGVWTGSMALLGDAGHNLSDVLGLILAWGAARLSVRRPSARHTYGLARSTILAALLNAALLLVACGALAWESILRIGEPHAVPGFWIGVTAFVAFVVNALSAAPFWHSRRTDANARAAFLHLAADSAVSLAVVVVGGLIALTGWHWLDAAAGLAIAAVIGFSSVGLMRESIDLALDAVPRGMDLAEIRAALNALPGVRRVHDLHVWPLSTTVAALTAHLEHDGTRVTDELLAEAQGTIAARFGINHSTLQFENVGCGTDCDERH